MVGKRNGILSCWMAVGRGLRETRKFEIEGWCALKLRVARGRELDQPCRVKWWRSAVGLTTEKMQRGINRANMVGCTIVV